MGEGHGGPDYTIPGEFDANGFDNNLRHETGVLSMARSGDPNSAGSQFFIMHKTSAHLDGKYSAFGRVLEGQDVVDKIAAAPRNHSDRPDVEQRMKWVTIDTHGVDYPPPEKV